MEVEDEDEGDEDEGFPNDLETVVITGADGAGLEEGAVGEV